MEGESAVHRVAAKLPPFWADRPALWFAQVEAQFTVAGITQEATKFAYVVSQLEGRYAAEVEDIITNPPARNAYSHLRNELIRRVSVSTEQRVRQVLTEEMLGERKPSQFLRHLRSFACKASLTRDTLLAHPDPDAPLGLFTDASNTAVGASLQQQIRNSWQPLAFFSKKLSDKQSAWPTYYRELLAVYEAVQHFRHILEAHPCTIYTDHKPLTYAFQQRRDKLPPVQLNHLSFIAQFTTDIQHVKGSANVVADALSRTDAASVVSLDYTALAQSQENDAELQDLLAQGSSLRLQQFRCSKCDRVFPTVNAVAPHYVRCGGSSSPAVAPSVGHVCPQCQRRFTTGPGLQLHRRSAHPGEFHAEQPVEKKARWADFEIRASASLEALLPDGVRNTNQVLQQQLFVQHGLRRNVEMIKGQRRRQMYKDLVASLRNAGPTSNEMSQHCTVAVSPEGDLRIGEQQVVDSAAASPMGERMIENQTLREFLVDSLTRE
uniref:C2H2-type domain-containing protein n=1 Tax=Trichuris muris TaxID=70415 RepID=A0A5S6R653_TRIMR